MDNHKQQYGGAKLSIKQQNGKEPETWIPTHETPEINSKHILNNLCSLKVVSSSSLCSMVLMGMLNPDGNIRKRSNIYRTDGTQTTPTERAERLRNVNEGLLEPYVCMKISLIHRGHSKHEWKEPDGKIVIKETTTKHEVKNEVVSQRLAALQMLCGENASDIIPDILSDCYFPDNDFTSFVGEIYSNCDQFSDKMGLPKIDDETKRVVNWIIEIARQNNYYIHIAFMDYIEGFVTVRDFFNSNPDPAKQLAISYQAAAVILILLLKGRIMSWDFHSRNLLTNGILLKCIDLGRIYKLGIGNDDSRTKKDRYQIKEFVFSVLLKKRGHTIVIPLFHFFNVSGWDSATPPPEQPDLTPLGRFSDDYKRILVDFPNKAYEFSSFTLQEKRKLVYEALIMIAFIDGITNACLYNSTDIKSSSIMRRVFHDAPDFTKRDTGLFSNFGNFLNHFTIDYDVFVRQQAGNGTVVADMNNALDEICRRLEPMLVPCSLPKRQDYSMFELQGTLYYDSEAEADAEEEVYGQVDHFDLKRYYSKDGEKLNPQSGAEAQDPPALMRSHEVLSTGYGGGGSNRRRRHKSNKKKKYKSRKIRSRRKRKITRKRGHIIR